MASVPYLKKHENGAVQLIVDDEPLLMRIGWVPQQVMDGKDAEVEPYWTKHEGAAQPNVLYTEAGEGPMDLDATLAFARRHGKRLILEWRDLWIGDKDILTEYYEPCVDRHGNAGWGYVSPFDPEAIEEEKRTFCDMMAYLKAVDGTEHTVIMVSLEKEIGLWGDARDHSKAAEALYRAEIPANVAERFGVSGTWHEAFGEQAEESFMAWAYASALNQAAEAGKAIYPLPVYVEPVVPAYDAFPGHLYPSGTPIPKMLPMWQLAAPAIDLYSQRILRADFRKACMDFQGCGQPLFMPSHACDPAQLLFMGGLGTLGGLANGDPDEMGAIAAAFDLLESMQDLIVAHTGTPRLQSFLRREGQDGEALCFSRYDLEIEQRLPGHKPPKYSGGFAIEADPDTFYLVAVNTHIHPHPKPSSDTSVEIESLQVGRFVDGTWEPGKEFPVPWHGKRVAYFDGKPRVVRMKLRTK